jgi:hypothetical protein
MGSAKVGRGKHLPLRIIPELGQVPENGIHPSNKQPRDVFHDNVAGSEIANGSSVLTPES